MRSSCPQIKFAPEVKQRRNVGRQTVRLPWIRQLFGSRELPESDYH